MIDKDNPRHATDLACAEIAPGGILRAGMNLTNTLFTQKDPATGELRGVSLGLMRELASRLGVPLELVMHESPGDITDAAGKGTWDVAVLAIEPSRAEHIAFTPPMTEIEATYAVHEDSPLRTVREVDAPGIRIAAAEKSGYELYLTRTLRNATLIRSKGATASIAAFNDHQADALAGLKPMLLDAMPQLPGARLIEGRFMTVNHGIGTPRGRRSAAEYLESFVEDITASGFLARLIERDGVQGLAAVR